MDEETYKLLSRLKKERGVHHQRITKYVDKVTASIKSDDAEEAQAMLDVVEVCHTQMDALSQQIRGLLEEKDFEKDMDDDVVYLAKLTRARTAVKTYLSTKKSPVKPAPAPVNSPVKLEGLSLPSFSGDVAKFPGFWNIFKSRVHQEANISAVEKFSYLLTKLKGPALAVVEGLPMTEDGYQSAYKLVLERYGKRLPLLNCHIMQLMEIAPSESMDVAHLRKLSDQLRVCSFARL